MSGTTTTEYLDRRAPALLTLSTASLADFSGLALAATLGSKAEAVLLGSGVGLAAAEVAKSDLAAVHDIAAGEDAKALEAERQEGKEFGRAARFIGSPAPVRNAFRHSSSRARRVLVRSTARA